MNWLMVVIGAVIGAPLRYLTDRAVQARHTGLLPWGTLTVNVAACTVLGFLTGAATATTVPSALQHLVGPGLCATLSTYSTFSFETVRLAETGARLHAAANVVVSVVAGLAAAFLGGAAAQALLG
ncbi:MULTISPECIES: fluoride efflux transporter FluC [unclassified Streptomyces]|uniref:fluoride efflux transporter FluC n=1 Tax=unclassified Streptomyces TaxID=2593676 RepID=UPI003CF02B23